MRDYDALMKKIDDMSIEELEQLMRAALDESECTKHFTVEEGFEAIRQFVESGGFKSPPNIEWFGDDNNGDNS